MVAPTDEECWINCVLTSQSDSKVLNLTRANIEIIETQRVKLLQKVELGGEPRGLVESE